MNLQQEINALNNEFKELNREMSQIRDSMKDIEDTKNALLSLLMRTLIGKAFKSGDLYYLISGVPQPEGMMNSINWYQIPYIGFNSNNVELFSDTLFSRACEYDDPIKAFRQDPIYEEITLEEFEKAYLELFEKKLDEIKIGRDWNG